MRFDNSVASASTKFMACMTLDAGTANAKTVSTYINTSDHQFDFFVTLNPLVPYRLRTSQLKAERDDALSIEYSKDQYLDVDVYYWMLPNNIRILSESFANAGFSGKQLRFAYARNEGTLYAGMAIISTATSLTLGDIGILPSSDKVKPSTQVRLLNSGERSLRAARYFCNSVSISPAYNKELYWTIIDNFGCESRFIIRGNDSDKGNTLLINDA
jgi:hypothetical protein